MVHTTQNYVEKNTKLTDVAIYDRKYKQFQEWGNFTDKLYIMNKRNLTTISEKFKKKRMLSFVS